MKNPFSPFVQNANNEKKPFVDNNRLARIIYKYKVYLKMVSAMRKKKIPLIEISRNMFPFLLPDPARPTAVSIEISSVCNLKCTYCPHHLNLRPRQFMSDITFYHLMEGIKDLGVSRAHISGNGEPTLHPKFANIIVQLAQSVKYLSVVTNGQWDDNDISLALLTAPVDLIEISVDGCDQESYERSRVGAKFDRLLNNLSSLKQKGKKHCSLIHARLMVRPSDEPHKKKMVSFWKHYADVVSANPVIKEDQVNDDEDVYLLWQFEKRSYPNRCAKLFRDINVFWDGRVPLCGSLEHRTGVPNPILGNVNTHSLKRLWNTPLMRQYRQGHRYRDYDKIPCCIGCRGN